MVRLEYVPDSIDDYNTQIKIELLCPGNEYLMKDYLIAFRAFLSGMSWDMETIDQHIVDPYSNSYITKPADQESEW